jgi:eukaryotic-like serine/threonine-protein kinase
LNKIRRRSFHGRSACPDWNNAMNSARHKKIESISKAALYLDPDRRDSYIREACSGDETLLREVETRMALEQSDDTVAGFPAGKPAENGKSEESEAGMIGRQLRQYLIVEKIGAGGMGVVYRAEDSRLQRSAVIKLLPPGKAEDLERKSRLLKEARAVSALNHPNIVTIYDVDQADGLDFIAMEWVEGKGLDQLIGHDGLPLEDALKYAVQIADALVQAHAKGIIHRDLKPSNVMIAGNSAKVLDFGLAKVLGRETSETVTEGHPFAETMPGLIVGTLAYMSPEQAQGKNLDARSDIFSFGCLLYEMVSGKHPFSSDSAMGTISSIIKDEPKPLPERIPVALANLIIRCLRKDPEQRFQSIADVRASLSDIIHRAAAARYTKLARFAFGRTARFAAVVLILMTMGFSALWLYWLIQSNSPNIPQFDVTRVKPSSVWEGEPAISPDGKWIAFTSSISGNRKIFVTDISGSATRQITSDSSDDKNPMWFSDGNSMAYISDRNGKSGLWKISPLGGSATSLLDDVLDASISPDQKNIAFSRADVKGYRIGIAGVNDPSRARMLTGNLDSTGDPALSPGGDHICYIDNQDLWKIEVTGNGAPKRLTVDGKVKQRPAWSPDGKRIYYSAFFGASLAIWCIDSDGGKPRRITNGMRQEGHPSLSRDGSLLIYAALNSTRALTLQNTETGEGKNVEGGEWMTPAISQDATRLIAGALRPGSNATLWSLPLKDGLPNGQLSRLTDTQGHLSNPSFSPDGQWIACHHTTGNKREILIIQASGGRPTQATIDPPQSFTPSWSPDGSRIAFATRSNTSSEILTLRITDGAPAGSPTIAATGFDTMAPVWMSNGEKLAFVDSKFGQGEVWLARADGSVPPTQLTVGAHAKRVKWDDASETLLVSAARDKQNTALFRVRMESGILEPISPAIVFGGLEAEGVFDISRNGKWLVFIQEKNIGEIWMLTATQGSF